MELEFTCKYCGYENDIYEGDVLNGVGIDDSVDITCEECGRIGMRITLRLDVETEEVE